MGRRSETEPRNGRYSPEKAGRDGGTDCFQGASKRSDASLGRRVDRAGRDGEVGVVTPVGVKAWCVVGSLLLGAGCVTIPVYEAAFTPEQLREEVLAQDLPPMPREPTSRTCRPTRRVKVTDAAGAPVAGASVVVEQRLRVGPWVSGLGRIVVALTAPVTSDAEGLAYVCQPRRLFPEDSRLPLDHAWGAARVVARVDRTLRSAAVPAGDDVIDLRIDAATP